MGNMGEPQRKIKVNDFSHIDFEYVNDMLKFYEYINGIVELSKFTYAEIQINPYLYKIYTNAK